MRFRLKTTDKGVRMFARPIKEIAEKLHDKEVFKVTDKELTTGKRKLEIPNDERLFDVYVTFKRKGNPTQLALKFGPLSLVYHFGKQEIINHKMPVRLKDGRMTLRIVIDRPMCEVVCNDGEAYLLKPLNLEPSILRLFHQIGLRDPTQVDQVARAVEAEEAGVLAFQAAHPFNLDVQYYPQQRDLERRVRQQRRASAGIGGRAGRGTSERIIWVAGQEAA